MTKPRLLDAFCCEGGSTAGYQRAGFHVTGIDLKAQPRYCGDAFIQGDALEYLAEHAREYDAVHASPPCQGYSIMRNLPWLRDKDYPLLIAPVLEILEASGTFYIVENVDGAKRELQAGWLCGGMFGLPFYRHRRFATNWPWMAPGHPTHRASVQSAEVLLAMNRRRGGDSYKTVGHASLADWQRGNGAQKRGVGVGHAAGWRLAAEAMGIDWMDRDGLSQAIPPVFTEYLGRALIERINR